MESSVSYIPELLRLILLAVAVAAALIAALTYRRNRMAIDTQQMAAPVRKIVYRDAPTVRISDAQRFDRLRRTIRLSPGEHADVLQAHPVVGPRFRITLNAIATNDAALAAHVTVVFGGTQVSCGPLAKELGFNEFLVPRAYRDESRTAVFHFQESGYVLDFMRITVRAIDSAENVVEFDVMHTRGKWPGAEEE